MLKTQLNNNLFEKEMDVALKHFFIQKMTKIFVINDTFYCKNVRLFIFALQLYILQKIFRKEP